MLAIAVLPIVAGLNTQADAATMLFDFETDDEVRLWHNEGATTLGADKTLERVERFVASGKYAMRFTTPAWRPQEHGGAQKWPAFECRPPLTDWSNYDRLVMSLVNETAVPQKLALFISDSKLPMRSGLLQVEVLEPFSQVQAVIDLQKGFAEKGVSAADIHVMHFFTEDPPEDLSICIDRLLLLEPGEEPPPLPGAYLKEIATLQSGDVEGLRRALTQSGARLRESAKASPRVGAWLDKALGGLEGRLSDLQQRLERADDSVLEVPKGLAQVRGDLARLDSLLALRLGFEAVRPAVQSRRSAREDVVVGFATSMEKVLPRAGVPNLTTAREVSLALARNERESLQVVVMPLEADLPAAKIRVTDLRGKDRPRLAAANVTASPVGYVETKATPPYGSSHVGWWPDPILTFMEEADIAQGDAQAFWVQVRAPKDQPAGVYRGTLELLSEDKSVFSFDLTVRVYGFEVPDTSPLPLAITFAPHDFPTPETTETQAKWRESPDYPINGWKEHRAEWADFLADYYITIDSLYEYPSSSPDFENLKRLHDEGRLGTFNLGYFSVLGEGDKALQEWPAGVLDRLRPRYERAKELGLLDHAYIYGCDEHPADQFPAVERAAAALKAAFPDVPVMTTTYDHSFGLESVIKSVDWWCPLTPRFDADKAAQARALGKQVWWYICCGPHHPFPNMFVEYPAIDGRVLMGAMTAKYRPDGFLYYQISIWNSQKPIESGPFTDWDPRSWTTYHGDGSWTCVGPGGTPLPTIRLENFRDGLEDHAYFLRLEAAVAKAKAAGTPGAERAEWLRQAEEALAVPPEVVAGLNVYTQKPEDVYRWRNRLAELIEAAD
ncbi:MAG: DUF4091 domain-containing protein [Armatimonadetes bacterium]|nr:DUF4091 domain-containing protein [Armatimonadota bacterium]